MHNHAFAGHSVVAAATVRSGMSVQVTAGPTPRSGAAGLGREGAGPLRPPLSETPLPEAGEARGVHSNGRTRAGG
ncbi:hypothetical protein SSMG_06961 [Streptomyces sp. AA4]|nr:hypothetical protein SSMG_06961 [Streptomyces sp. AA4]